MDAAAAQVARMFNTTNEQKALLLLLGTEFTEAAMAELTSHDVMLPFTFLLARPYNTYRASAVIATKMGAQTAQTFTTDARFIPNVDGTTHVSTGSLIYRVKSVVKRPQDVFVGHSASVTEYISGENAKVIDLPTRTNRHTFNPSQHKFGGAGLRGRPTASYRTNAPSVHVLMVPYTWAHDPSTSARPITLHKTLHVNYGNMLPAVRIPPREDYGFPSFEWYDHHFEWTTKIVPSPDPYAEHLMLVNQVSPSNPVMWRGRTVRFDPNNEQFGPSSAVTTPDTHWGSKIEMSAPGCMNARIGLMGKSRQM